MDDEGSSCGGASTRRRTRPPPVGFLQESDVTGLLPLQRESSELFFCAASTALWGVRTSISIDFSGQVLKLHVARTATTVASCVPLRFLLY